MYIVIEPKNEDEEEISMITDVKKYVILFENIEGNCLFYFISSYFSHRCRI